MLSNRYVYSVNDQYKHHLESTLGVHSTSVVMLTEVICSDASGFKFTRAPPERFFQILCKQPRFFLEVSRGFADFICQARWLIVIFALLNVSTNSCRRRTLKFICHFWIVTYANKFSPICNNNSIHGWWSTLCLKASVSSPLLNQRPFEWQNWRKLRLIFVISCDVVYNHICLPLYSELSTICFHWLQSSAAMGWRMFL